MVFIKQLSVCDVPQLFESLASVVPIKLVRVAHCGVPRRALRCAASRIAVRRALRHTVRTWAVVGKK